MTQTRSCASGTALQLGTVRGGMRRRPFLAGVVAAGLAGCLDRADGGESGTEPSPTPGTGLSAVTLVPRAACPDPGGATVRFGDDPVAVVGCVVGQNGCTRPRVASVDRDGDAVELVVAAVEERETDEVCTEALVNLGYEARLGYVEPPTSVTVVHDDVHGRRVVTDATR